MKRFTLFFVMILGAFVFGQQDVPQSERDELVKFYNALDGIKWRNKTYWTTNNPVSQWAGINVEVIDGTPHVTEISLVDNNIIGDIDLNLPYLVKLYIPKNNVGNLKVKSDKLEILNLEDNEILTSVDLTEAINIVDLNLANNKLESIDLSNHNKLVDINLNNNLLNKIDLSQSTVLSNIELKNNKLTEVKIGAQSNFISFIDLSNNQLTEFNLGNYPILRILVLDYNKIKKIELKNLSKLESFSVINNFELSEIKFSNLPNLHFLTLDNNKLTQVDLTSLKSLISLELNNNPLNKGILDLSNNIELQTISIKNTSVELINMRNHSDGAIVEISDKVKCIAIDDPAQKPNWNIQWMNGREGNYKTDCKEYLSTNDNVLQDNIKLVSPVIESLILITNKRINKIEIYSITGQLVKTLIGKDRNISNLSKGLYLAKIYSEEGYLYNQKFIKK